MQFAGHYINLSACPERNENMRQRLSALGVLNSYRRFEAIRGADAPQRSESPLTDGHLGCFLSHRAVWAEGLKSGQHLHILEDDAVLSPVLVALLKNLELDADSWDLLFTDAYLHPPPTPENFVRLKFWMQAFAKSRKITLADLKDLPFTGTTSYLVNRCSIGKLQALMDGQWKLNRTFDVLLQDFVRDGKIRATVTIPFVSTISAENIDSSTGAQGPSLKALNAFREALYYKSDPERIYNSLKESMGEQETEPVLGIYLELLRNVLGSSQIS
jgi:GR25 family glycosyltransferase involved in LPS biosynthesis